MLIENLLGIIEGIAFESGIAHFFEAGGWKNAIMMIVGIVLLYLAIFKGFEPSHFLTQT